MQKANQSRAIIYSNWESYNLVTGREIPSYLDRNWKTLLIPNGLKIIRQS